jgi:2-polyprenyl-3-methyl-5-hydroxy-6-metoxy-1,4-benzoquinol methylase
LDAGCGEHGSIDGIIGRLVGIDLNRDNILKMRKKRKSDFVVGSLTCLPFQPDVFDTIICQDVLEHIEEKAEVITEVSLVLKLGGRFIGSTSNQLNPLMRLDSISTLSSHVLSKYIGTGHYERHSRLTPKSLNKMLEHAGFNTHLSFFGYPPFKPWLYEYCNMKPPRFVSLWILLDKITEHVKILKEMMVFEATKHSPLVVQGISTDNRTS